MSPGDSGKDLVNTRRRLFAHPWLSAGIALVWLLLQGSLGLADLIWAAVIGLLLPWLVQDFIGPGTRPRAAGVALRLAATVLWDIVLANMAVARLVLHPGVEPRPAWVRVPYTLSDGRAVALLAMIITNTPGTVSCMVDEKRRDILVHVLNTTDPDAIVAEILQRYEQPLKEIFQ